MSACIYSRQPWPSQRHSNFLSSHHVHRIQHLTLWVLKIINCQLRNVLNWKHWAKSKPFQRKHLRSRESSLIISNISTHIYLNMYHHLIDYIQYMNFSWTSAKISLPVAYDRILPWISLDLRPYDFEHTSKSIQPHPLQNNGLFVR